MSNKSMQAILVNEYGGPNVLKVETVERPQHKRMKCSFASYMLRLFR